MLRHNLPYLRTVPPGSIQLSRGTLRCIARPNADRTAARTRADSRDNLVHDAAGCLWRAVIALQGQSDLVIGTPIANRTRSELEGLIGFFVNTLALRLDLSGNPPFTALLERVRNVTTSAYTHQDLPFEMLVAKLVSKRHLSQTPLFQVMFNLLNISERRPEAASQPRRAEPDPLPADRLPTPATEFDEPTKFDLTLYALE